MEDNVVPLKPNMKRVGITLSFLLETKYNETIQAQVNLEKLATAIAQWVKTEFPHVKHTLTSRQEYEP